MSSPSEGVYDNIIAAIQTAEEALFATKPGEHSNELVQMFMAISSAYSAQAIIRYLGVMNSTLLQIKANTDRLVLLELFGEAAIETDAWKKLEGV